MIVKRAEIDNGFFTPRMISIVGARLRKDIPEPEELDLESAAGLAMPLTEGVDGAGYFSIAEPDNHDQIMEFLVPACYWGAAFWRLAADETKSVKVWYHGKQVEVLSGEYTCGRQESWIPTWGLAWTLRYQPLIDALLTCGAQVPNRDNVNGPGIWDFYCGALEHFHNRSEFWIPAARECLWQSDPTQVTEEERVAFQDVHGVAKLLLAFEEPENTDRFNQALYDALYAHRQKLIDLNQVIRNERQFAWVPLGLACIAHDQGIPIQVQSDYAPDWLIRGEFDATYHPPGVKE